jgi:hypothetical protein
MGDEVPLELTVSEEAAKAALQRDDLDAPELFAKLDFLIQVYDILDSRMNPQTNDDLREILLLLNENIELPPGDAAMVLSSLGVVEDTGQGWTTTD